MIKLQGKDKVSDVAAVVSEDQEPVANGNGSGNGGKSRNEAPADSRSKEEPQTPDDLFGGEKKSLNGKTQPAGSKTRGSADAARPAKAMGAEEGTAAPVKGMKGIPAKGAATPVVEQGAKGMKRGAKKAQPKRGRKPLARKK